MAYAIIDDPEKHFNTKTYTGNLLQHPVVGLNHQPDFLWFKNSYVYLFGMRRTPSFYFN